MKFSYALHSIGFRRSLTNEYLFILEKDSRSVYLLVYVDDIILTRHRATVDNVKQVLA